MKAAEAPHQILKRYEQLVRDLDEVAKRLSPDKRAEAEELRDLFRGVSDEHGHVTLRTRPGGTAHALEQSEARARELVAEGIAHD